jgi:hypothetical protein
MLRETIEPRHCGANRYGVLLRAWTRSPRCSSRRGRYPQSFPHLVDKCVLLLEHINVKRDYVRCAAYMASQSTIAAYPCDDRAMLSDRPPGTQPSTWSRGLAAQLRRAAILSAARRAWICGQSASGWYCGVRSSASRGDGRGLILWMAICSFIDQL